MISIRNICLILDPNIYIISSPTLLTIIIPNLYKFSSLHICKISSHTGIIQNPNTGISSNSNICILNSNICIILILNKCIISSPNICIIRNWHVNRHDNILYFLIQFLNIKIPIKYKHPCLHYQLVNHLILARLTVTFTKSVNGLKNYFLKVCVCVCVCVKDRFHHRYEIHLVMTGRNTVLIAGVINKLTTVPKWCFLLILPNVNTTQGVMNSSDWNQSLKSIMVETTIILIIATRRCISLV